MEKALWLTYDFGLKGDYSGLYTWLDNHKAIECGTGIAFFKYSSKHTNYKLVLEDLKEELTQSVKLSKTDRLYIVIRDDNTNKVKGVFLNGARRQAPWEGYGAPKRIENVDSE